MFKTTRYYVSELFAKDAIRIFQEIGIFEAEWRVRKLGRSKLIKTWQFDTEDIVITLVNTRDT